MAVIQNIINTIFNTSGDRDAENAANRVGRAQNRLGQSSTAAGRGFAAQSQGLGGLVAAYAGAAATTFALSAAFDALARSARAAQTLEGLTSLAADSAIAGQDLLKSVKEITKGQLSLVEAAEQINLSLSAGFDTSQIEGLAGVASKASRALGRDLADSFTRVVRGSAKLETELLDELGIYTKIEPATKAYAAAIGTTANKLTEFQRRQAFVNSVIAEGERKFSSINTTIPTSAEKIEAFAKTISDLVTKIGIFVTNGVAPLAEFLTDNLAASFAVLGLAGAAVFGKLFSEVGNFAKGIQKRSLEIRNNIQNNIIDKFGRTAQAARDAGQQAAKSLDLRPDALSRAGRGELSSLRNLANQRALSNDELRRANTLLAGRAQLLSSKRTAILQEVKDQRAIARSTAVTNAERAAATQRVTALQNSLVRLRSITSANIASMNALTAATTGAAFSFARLGSAAVAALVTIGAGLATIVSRFITIGSYVLGAVAIFGLFTAAIFNALGRTEELNAFIKKIGQNLKEINGQAEKLKNRKIFQGLAAGALADLEKTNTQLRETESFTFRKKVLFVDVEITKTKQDVVDDVSKLLTNISTNSLVSKSEQKGTVIGAAIAGGITGGLAGSFGSLPTIVAGALLGATVGGVGAYISTAGRAEVDASEKAYTNVQSKFAAALNSISDRATRDNITQALAQYEKEYEDIAKVSPDARLLLDTLQELVLKSAKFADNVDEIYQIIKATGQSSEDIANNFTDFISPTVAPTLSITFTEIEGQEIPISFLPENLDDFFANTQASFDTFINSLDLSTLILEDIGNTAGPSGLQELSSIRDKLKGALDRGAATQTLTDLNKEIENLGFSIANIDTENLQSIFEGLFSDATLQSDDANSSILRVTKVLRDLSEGAGNNSLSFEQYEQGLSAVVAGVNTTTLKIAAAEKALTAVEASSLGGSSLGQQIALQLRQRLEYLKEALSLEERTLKILKEQKNEYIARNNVNDFIKSIKIDDIPTLEFELALNTAGLESQTLATITYLNEAFESLQTQVTSFNTAATAAKNLPEASRQLALSTPLTNATEAKELAAALNSVGDVAATAVSSTVVYTNKLNQQTGTLVTLTKQQINANQTASDLSIAMQALAKEGLVEVTKAAREQIAELDNLVKANNAAIDKINAEEAEIEFTATIDRQSLARDLAIIKQEGVLEALELDIELTKAKEQAKTISPEESAAKVNELQQNVLTARERLLTIETDNQLAAIDAKQSIAEFEAQAAKDEAKNKADILRAEITAKQKELNALADIYSTFLDGQQKSNQQLQGVFVTGANAASKAIAETFQRATLAISTAIVQGFQGNAKTQIVAPGQASATDLDTFDTAFADVRRSLQINTILGVDSVDRLEKAEKDLADTRLEQAKRTLDAERNNVIESANIKLQGIQVQREIEDEAAKSRIADAKDKGKDDDTETEAERLAEKTRSTLLALFDGVESALNTAITDFGNLILYGEGNIRDIFSNLFKSIQQTLFQETIAKPLSGFITEKIFKQTRRGIENAKFDPVTGGLKVYVANLPNALVGNIERPKTDAAKTVTDALSGEGGIFSGITSFFEGIFGQGGFFSKLFSSIGSLFSGGGAGGFFSTLFQGVVSLFGMASGGTVHRAGGGSIPSVMNRDRVSALLEPGEFVIRKPMARQIGTPALQQLNATGKTSGGDVQVNITNQGTPQQAQASAPRFDGEKYVIDVITRDLANNGPIRRSLRGDR